MTALERALEPSVCRALARHRVEWPLGRRRESLYVCRQVARIVFAAWPHRPGSRYDVGNQVEKAAKVSIRVIAPYAEPSMNAVRRYRIELSLDFPRDALARAKSRD